MKRLVVYTAENCEGCDEAREVAREVATRHGLEVEEVDITATPEESPVAVAPSVCVVDTEEGLTPLKCVIGVSEKTKLRRDVEKMLELKPTV